MSTSNQGAEFEAVVLARQRLRILYWVLAVVGAFSVWTGPPPGHFDAFSRGAGWIMIVLSALGWCPYLISWFYARSVLDGSSRLVNAFSVGAVVTTLVAAGLYQRVFGLSFAVPAPLISLGVTLALLGLAKVCGVIGEQPLRDE